MRDDDPIWIALCNRDKARDYAWEEAESHFLETGIHLFTDKRAQRCVESNRRNDRMTDICWDALIAQYPIGEIE